MISDPTFAKKAVFFNKKKDTLRYTISLVVSFFQSHLKIDLYMYMISDP